MGIKRKLDFVLQDDNNEKLIFRFYPRRSHCHSFDDKPPTCWQEVYKVYYSYAIIHTWKRNNKTEVRFYCHCDECSVIDEVAEAIRLLSEGKKVFENEIDGRKIRIKLLDKTIRPFGFGVTWMLHKEHNLYEVLLLNYNSVGYCIRLDKEILKEFGLYLQSCCEYMLAHGEPI